MISIYISHRENFALCSQRESFVGEAMKSVILLLYRSKFFIQLTENNQLGAVLIICYHFREKVEGEEGSEGW